MARYQSWESYGPDDAARLIDGQRGMEPDVPGTWLQLAIAEKATGVVVGDCGLHCRKDDPRQMELGVTLAPSHQGRGYATEALSCVIDFVFGTLGKHRISATTDAENNSAAALFRRLGFRQEAHFVEHLVQGALGQRVRVWPVEAGVGIASGETGSPLTSFDTSTKQTVSDNSDSSMVAETLYECHDAWLFFSVRRACS